VKDPIEIVDLQGINFKTIACGVNFLIAICDDKSNKFVESE
jgi:hypothetical protein